MSDKPLPFSNGLQLKSMGAVLLLVLGVLIWRLTDATTTTARVLYVAAIVFELLFFVGLIFASRFIKAQHDKAEAAYRAQVAAAQAEAAPNDDGDAAPGSGRPDAP
ncbi:hypothetical protein TPB0596_36360 [Tsukamurella pulmonis]|uniref:Uncharacterized protein n=1 Tax=Tsukamurella pulmonis TaxID=47312 RepID=A0A1H1CM93_9ACTN|nr:hypothetical protein [Tsukamurella pulmonis]KXO89837.1 hypothetical protein AXK56_06680 [Tsukamurella pulmonis]KXP11093.1 hypothetical protein AXK57_06935 [Tsukamurella pulmonis]RDH10296.1 hypothetical protein DVB88_18710 [Tsukamurella pulmonis]SDQ65365.1 hypothetical protein SAMN04489765_1282 [Tsukamurella pulmonis]SUP23486.1 Uncharacterised protein [Tsukamurella pulmonis]